MWSRPVAACRYHPETPGMGICVRCETVICAACCTRLQGINYCHECLKSLGRSRIRALGSGGAMVSLALLGLAWILLFLLLWLAEGGLAP